MSLWGEGSFCQVLVAKCNLEEVKLETSVGQRLLPAQMLGGGGAPSSLPGPAQRFACQHYFSYLALGRYLLMCLVFTIAFSKILKTSTHFFV